MHQLNFKKKSCRVTLCKSSDSCLQNPLGVSKHRVWIQNVCAGRLCSTVLQRDCSRAQSKKEFKGWAGFCSQCHTKKNLSTALFTHFLSVNYDHQTGWMHLRVDSDHTVWSPSEQCTKGTNHSEFRSGINRTLEYISHEYSVNWATATTTNCTHGTPSGLYLTFTVVAPRRFYLGWLFLTKVLSDGWRHP